MTAAQSRRHSSVMPMVIVAILFFVLGFATWLNGSLMPYLKQMLDLTPLQASLILFSFYIAVTFTALPSAWLIGKVGYKNGMALGMAIMMLAGLLYIPAAQTQTFALFLLAQLVIGAGQTLLQAAVNPYVVKIGPQSTAAVRISIMGILNKTAGVAAPVVFTTLMASSFASSAPNMLLNQSQIDVMASGLVLPYLGLAIFLGILALAVKFSPLPELTKETSHGTGFAMLKAALAKPSLMLGVMALFVYVAVEVIAGDTIGLFALSLGVERYTVMTSYTMGCMVLGYVLGILLIPRLLSQQTALASSAVLGLILTMAVAFGNTETYYIANALLVPFGGFALPDTLMFIALLGLANAIVWPAVWPLALSGLGHLTSIGSALLIMGIAGGAFGPLFWGLLSGTGLGQQGAYLVMLPCYALILFYAVKGHKLRSWR
ncbi:MULTISPECIES: N-acetylglucosamine MFS transporter NagP [unclassified Arsukibacterium]|uniref:N-acetylglucosamine MFS transporter NagP n=1 Tax=unclassified Arsukibacterium TaxID=2635278 RepID=UPI000C550081|nr:MULTISPECIES: sugar MFS transporter [unclassified Arsukibacterium]MAA93300.1 glucose/galactose MFS transporter [Rheinheimera sp.]MBM34208.1 glucose/galactose MFS transporter [Rheinheimera sp.]HAW92208.1 glucose/galactose MFS transporter [Candidatus Azambacteria bacterium]